MLFPTIQFAIFFLIVFRWLAPPAASPRWKMFMILASYVFYGWWDWRFCPPARRVDIVANSVRRQASAPTGAGTQAGCARAAPWSATSACSAYFKYYDFFVARRSSTRLDELGVHVSTPPFVRSCCPIGISFFTFQAISYVIDIVPGQWRAGAAARLRRVPVVLRPPGRRADRAGQRVRPAARRRRPTPATSSRPRRSCSSSGGLFKKVVISSFLARRSSTRCSPLPDAHSRLGGAVGDLRLRHPDLRRLQRLHRHRHRRARCCSASASRRTSTRRTGRSRCRTSGAGGT